MRFVKYLIAAGGPVVLAWVLGFVTLPEATHFLDYSRGGSELLGLNEELKKEVKVLVGGEEKDQLSLYSVHFVNKSGRHHGETRLSFNIEGIEAGSELIASSLQGPENYPQASIYKERESESGVTFVLDHVNRSGDQARNYFTASFLFSGDPPMEITPISHEKGIEFRPASENTRDVWITGVVFIGVFVAYVWFLWWVSKKSNLKLKDKRDKYRKKLHAYISDEFDADPEEASGIVDDVERIRNESYRQPGLIKRFVRGMVDDN